MSYSDVIRTGRPFDVLGQEKIMSQFNFFRLKTDENVISEDNFQKFLQNLVPSRREDRWTEENLLFIA